MAATTPQTITVDQALERAASKWSGGGAQDRAAARQLVHQVLRVAPDHAGALNLAACAAFEDGVPGVALALFEKAVARSPRDHNIQANLARAEFAVGRVEAARRRAEFIASAAEQASQRAIRGEIEASLAQARRDPAVASTFFAGDPVQLGKDVDGFLQAQPVPRLLLQRPKALIVPHAGHVYSGGTAGKAYARIQAFGTAAAGFDGDGAQPIRRVILLGPAHRVYFKGVALPGVGAYLSPLGPVPIDTLAADAIADLPQVTSRPDAHAPEHSLEVHLPFLQRCFDSFELLPLVVGDARPEDVAEVIERLWGGPETLIVISTDLSHYHPYDEANAIDTASCERVMALDASLDHQQACGATPVNALLQIAARRSMRIEQVERVNSGDTAGDKSRVVGYASFALYEPPAAGSAESSQRAMKNLKASVPAAPASGEFTAEQGLQLVKLARASLHAATGAPPVPEPPAQAFQGIGAAFVTLTSEGALRGCIGSLAASRPLADDVRANAAAAALHDHRFPRVSAQEAPGLQVEVSVLTEAQPLIFANESHAIWQLQPGVHGVIFECEHQGRQHRSTYLPQVWEQLPGARAFLAHLKVKAGLPFDFWSPNVKLSVYRVQKFHEPVHTAAGDDSQQSRPEGKPADPRDAPRAGHGFAGAGGRPA